MKKKLILDKELVTEQILGDLDGASIPPISIAYGSCRPTDCYSYCPDTRCQCSIEEE
jgi:hypothetical protein